MKKIIYALALLSYTSLCISFSFIDNKTDQGTLSPDFIKETVATFHPTIFFETGTYNGQNAESVAPFFSHVHTVELGKELFEESQKKLSKLKNVTIYKGSSPAFIEKIAPNINGHILFWLDAHFSGGKTALSNDNTNDPDSVTAIRNELHAIKKNNIQNCTILIDDIRGFGSVIDETEFLGCWAYPSIQEVCRLGKEINPNFSFALLGDMLLMYDSSQFEPQLSPIVRACTASRLYDGNNLNDKELIECEKIIMQASGQEKKFIAKMYQQMTDWKDPMFNHDLWYGLTCMGSGNWQEALSALEKVPHRIEYLNKCRETVEIPRNYDHWRIDSYISEIKSHLN